jgi:hypothetical protein
MLRAKNEKGPPSSRFKSTARVLFVAVSAPILHNTPNNNSNLLIMSKRPSDDNHIEIPKRLRGGGFDDFVEDLFDDDQMMEQEQQEPPPIDSLLPKDLSETMKSKWSRAPVKILGNDEDLSFQWLDIDLIGGKALGQNPNMSKKVLGAAQGQVPILRVYGVTMEGNSVAAFLHGFTPYAYFALPPGMDFDSSEATLSQLRSILNTKLQAAARGFDKTMDMVHGVKYLDNYTSIMGYDSKHIRFLKIHVAMPNLIAPLKRIMEQGVPMPGQSFDTEFAAFECNVPFVLRFMIDCDISGAGWLTLPKSTFQIRRGSKLTHCQVSTYN